MEAARETSRRRLHFKRALKDGGKWVGGGTSRVQVSQTVLTLFPVSQRVEDQVNLRKEELEELFADAPSLGAEAGDTDVSIERRFLDLLEPLGRRKKQLELSKAKLQISRDLEDETVSGLQPLCPES